ncbi:LOW QUALITY PROTEIN: ATP-dependent RNA helicase DHX58-like [Pholidichthys leucotaenia]
MEDFRLRSYQKEVVQKPLRGENVIIWLPTGGGKTRAAVYVAKNHLETRERAKVMVLVNRVHLVDQHYEKEFDHFLGGDYTVRKVSGATDEKVFGLVVNNADVIICTAQILHNSMIDKEEGRHVELSDITLLIIDECHHTQKGTPYNRLNVYVEKKLRGEQPLPQILGLNHGFPGTGKAKTKEKAVEHILQICANLDSAIVSTKNYRAELVEGGAQTQKEFNIVEKRPKDPFGDHVKMMMEIIHGFMNLPRDVRLRKCGTQEYEGDVVLLEKRGVEENNRLLAQCAIHLRKYNDALIINDTLRMIDAYHFLENYYTKFNTGIDGTDVFLVGLFQENRVELKKYAQNPGFENPKMGELKSVLFKQFGEDISSRGILFTKTRKSTNSLNDWINETPAFKAAGIKAAILTGTGHGDTFMTQTEQRETIRNFRQGALNILIATSVAEEGLDIPECNLVVRYGLITNDIAQQQASGRARATNSRYSVVAQANGREVHRECLNEYLEELTVEAVSFIQNMSEREFQTKITELQIDAMRSLRMGERFKMEKRSRYCPYNVKLLCRNCLIPVASGSDIKLVDNVQYVNVNPDSSRVGSEIRHYYRVGSQVMLGRTFEDWEPGCKINCSNCNLGWGFEVKYKEIALLPNLAIKNFALETPDGRKTPKKWKDVEFMVEDFSFEEYYQENSDFLD